MRDDYQRFANLRFLRTVDPDLLKRFFERHAIPADALDLGLLVSDPDKGREAVATYLLRTPKDQCPESLTADLHRIERLGRPVGQEALLQEARRRGVELVPPEALSKTSARNLALRAFINHPEVFEDAENGLAFLQPPSVMEFVAPEEGIPADLSEDRLRALEAHARAIFQADLRGEFCEAMTYHDGDEVHVSIRHGAALTITEVVEGSRKRIRSFREIDNAVLAYSAIDGRLKVWGCSKSSRPTPSPRWSAASTWSARRRPPSTPRTTRSAPPSPSTRRMRSASGGPCRACGSTAASASCGCACSRPASAWPPDTDREVPE